MRGVDETRVVLWRRAVADRAGVPGLQHGLRPAVQRRAARPDRAEALHHQPRHQADPGRPLDEPINLYFFYSDSGARELVPLRNYARRVEELLRAYEREAHGRIRLQVIDPEPFSENEDKATEFGLQGIPLQQGGDNLYFGLAGSNALDGVQVIPFFPLDQEEFLEYDISRLVQTLASRSGRWSA